jgi:hypothetical protein
MQLRPPGILATPRQNHLKRKPVKASDGIRPLFFIVLPGQAIMKPPFRCASILDRVAVKKTEGAAAMRCGFHQRKPVNATSGAGDGAVGFSGSRR